MIWRYHLSFSLSVEEKIYNWRIFVREKEKVVRTIALKFLVKNTFHSKTKAKKFYSHVKDVVCCMRLGNCRLLWRMPSAVTGVNIITNRKHVVHRDTRRGFSSRSVFISNNFDIWKKLTQKPQKYFQYWQYNKLWRLVSP